MKKIVLIISILGFSLTTLFSQNSCFDSVVEQLYSYESTSVITESIESVFMECDQMDSDLDQILFESYYYYYLGMVNSRDNDKRNAKINFQKSFDAALYALSLRESLEVYTRLAATGFQLSAAKGLGSIISMGEELDSYIEMVLEIAPNDPLGVVMKAQRKVHAPKFAGGDPEEALLLLQSNLDIIDSLSNTIKFDTYMAASVTYEKLDLPEEALDYAQMALELYPNNKEVIDWINEQL